MNPGSAWTEYSAGGLRMLFRVEETRLWFREIWYDDCFVWLDMPAENFFEIGAAGR